MGVTGEEVGLAEEQGRGRAEGCDWGRGAGWCGRGLPDEAGGGGVCYSSVVSWCTGGGRD